jgi:hypothetical protein
VGEFGCRVLHLASDVFEPNKLCIEGKFGIKRSITEKEFNSFFSNNSLDRQKFNKTLPVDLVVLAMP